LKWKPWNNSVYLQGLGWAFVLEINALVTTIFNP